MQFCGYFNSDRVEIAACVIFDDSRHLFNVSSFIPYRRRCLSLNLTLLRMPSTHSLPKFVPKFVHFIFPILFPSFLCFISFTDNTIWCLPLIESYFVFWIFSWYKLVWTLFLALVGENICIFPTFYDFKYFHSQTSRFLLFLYLCYFGEQFFCCCNMAKNGLIGTFVEGQRVTGQHEKGKIVLLLKNKMYNLCLLQECLAKISEC